MLSGFDWRLHCRGESPNVRRARAGRRPPVLSVRRGTYRAPHAAITGEPVSIFMLPGPSRAEELVDTLGHEAAIWSTGDRSFVLVTRGTPADVERMAAFVKGAIQ